MKSQHTTVLMPDDSLLHVNYYCIDSTVKEEEKELTNLVIQFDDCINESKIDKALCADKKLLERTVHNKVINSKGHLCY